MNDLTRYYIALKIWQDALNSFLSENPMRLDMVTNAAKRIETLTRLIDATLRR